MTLPQGRLEEKLDLRLGQLAVRKGRITPEQLKDALAEQARGVERGRKRPRRLGSILAEKKFMTYEEVRALLEEQEARILSDDRRRREDSLLGRILVDAALVDAAHVEEGLRLQAKAVEEGAERVPLLGELLIEKGFATSGDIDQGLDLQRRFKLACAECRKEYGIVELPVDKMDRCPQCGGLLEGKLPESETTVKTKAPPPPEPPPPPPPPPPPAEENQSLGRYRNLRRIGQGAIGAVYEALDPQLNRKVALKVLRSDLETVDGAGASEVKRFIREAQLAANLPKHPNIVAVYEAGAQDGRHFIAMEFIQGGTLGEWRKKAGVPLRKQVRAIRDVALAVHHAHEHGVLHRDLKPGNILIDSEGKPFVVDFGLARPVDPAAPDASGTHRICGTPAYMAPEQAAGAADLDAKCDVFALGAVLYEVLTGRQPFTGRNRQEVLQKLLSDAVPEPPGGAARSRPFSSVDGAIEKICLKALARDRAERTPSARAFAKELSGWLEAADKAKAGEALTGVPRWRRPALLAGGAAGLFLALILLLPLLRKKPDFERDLQQAAAYAGSGDTETAFKFYEEILRRDPANARAKEGREVMRRRRLSEAAKKVDEAISAVDRAKADADDRAKALQKATLADELKLRDEAQAALARVRDAEEQLKKARERFKQMTEAQDPPPSKTP